jgi:hypothetical protein
LGENGSSIIVANGLDYPIFPKFREVSATVIQKKDELGLMPASTSRSFWRQLSAITIKRRAGSDQLAGPLALQHNRSNQSITLWIGALVTDKAKIEDLIEACYSIPGQMLEDVGRLAYEHGVKYAEDFEYSLIQAVKSYSTELKIDSPSYDRARQHFWTNVEQSLSALFEVAKQLIPVNQLGKSRWGQGVRSSALDAFGQVCPRYNPRQIQAFAQGLRRFFSLTKTILTTNSHNE